MTSAPNILHLEDSDLDAEIVRGRLALAGLAGRLERVVGRSDYLERLSHQQYDLILSDYQVPGIDAFEALELARAASPQTPFLFVSGAMGEEVAIEALQRGATDYILKENLTRLASAIERALAEAREREELTRAEQRLREIEERFSFVRNYSGVGFWYCDLPFDVLGWDDNVKRHFHLPSTAHVTIDTFYEGLHPEDRDRVRAAIEDSLSNRRPYDIDYRTVDRSSGKVRWLRAIGRTFYTEEGAPKRFDGVTIDITERKNVEEALEQLLQDEKRRSELLARVSGVSRSINADLSVESISRVLTEEARSILSATESVTTIRLGNDPVGRRRFVSRAGTESETAGPGALLSPKYLLRANLTGYGEREIGTIEVWRHGRSPFREDEQAVLHQLTALATIAIENALLYESLREQDRRKDEFLATLAHELRNPLAPVRTGLEILKVEGQQSEGSRIARDMMERQIRQMVRLVDDLLDVSRVSRGKVQLKKSVVNLREVVALALETSLPLIETVRHHLTVDLPDEPIALFVDLTRIAQVLSNLLNNAAKYTPEGGRLSLSARRDGGVIVLTVEDNGIGIAEEMLPGVFELFTQVGRSIDQAQGGLGIGLSLVKKLTEMHGGTVSVVSSPGVGSAFAVRLPIAAGGDTKDDRDVNEAPEAASVRKRRVLVVDDNVDGAESLAMLLSLAGHDARTAHSGVEALRVAKSYAPDLVFLDLGLPGMDGFEVARILRADADYAPMKLVALTGWGSAEDKRRSKAAGFDGHLTKPVEVSEVEEILRRS